MARPAAVNGNSRDRILDAAEEMMAQQGYSGASVKAIAQKAGVTGAMIHYYFDNKDSLYAAVLTRIVGELKIMAADILATRKPPIERLEIYVGWFFDYVLKHPGFACISRMGIGGADRSHLSKIVREQFAPLFDMGAAFVKEGVETGIFQPIDERHLLTAFYSLFVSAFADSEILSDLSGLDLNDPDEIARRKKFLTDMAFRALGVRRKDSVTD